MQTRRAQVENIGDVLRGAAGVECIVEINSIRPSPSAVSLPAVESPGSKNEAIALPLLSNSTKVVPLLSL